MSADLAVPNPVLAEHVAEIRRLGKRVVADVVEIGRHLIECKSIVGHGNWELFLAQELGWCDRTALNFMRVAELIDTKPENFSDVNLPVSSLYLLAAPSTPEQARDGILDRAEAGEKISVNEVKEIIAKAKGGDGGGTFQENVKAAIAGTRKKTGGKATPTTNNDTDTDTSGEQRKAENAARYNEDSGAVQDRTVETWLTQKDAAAIARKIVDTVSEAKADAVRKLLLNPAAPKGKSDQSDKPKFKKLSMEKTTDADGNTVHALEPRGNRSRLN